MPILGKSFLDDPAGISVNTPAINKPNLGTEKSRLGTVYAERVVTSSEDTSGDETISGNLTVTGSATGGSFIPAGSTSVFDNQGIVVDGSAGGFIVITDGGHLGQSVANTISAAGNATGNATVITEVFTNVTTVGASTGVRFATLPAGSNKFVKNSGANALTVYPPTGGTINGGIADAGVSIAVGAIGVFIAMTSSASVAGEMPAA